MYLLFKVLRVQVYIHLIVIVLYETKYYLSIYVIVSKKSINLTMLESKLETINKSASVTISLQNVPKINHLFCLKTPRVMAVSSRQFEKQIQCTHNVTFSFYC